MRFVAPLSVFFFLGFAATPAWAVCDDPNGPRPDPSDAQIDCDGDGFSPADGDCDDDAPSVYPGAPAVCGDELDNDCNGFVDEGCDRAWERGGLEGGAGCAGGASVALLGLIPLGFRRRR